MDRGAFDGDGTKTNRIQGRLKLSVFSQEKKKVSFDVVHVTEDPLPRPPPPSPVGRKHLVRIMIHPSEMKRRQEEEEQRDNSRLLGCDALAARLVLKRRVTRSAAAAVLR